MTAATSTLTESARLEPVEVGEISLGRYARDAGADAVEALYQQGRALRGLRVLHVNATKAGGGVAEMLSSMVPLLRDIGVDCEWRALVAPPQFFEVTKQIHNRLQGANKSMTPAEQGLWLDVQQSIAAQLDGDYDVVVIHDPQPFGLAHFAKRDERWVWRLHIDSSQPHDGAWAFLSQFLDAYDALAFTLPEFVPDGVPPAKVRIVAPAIDPLTPKNGPIPMGTAQAALVRLGIDLQRPLISQVSRLDPWKDPIGVIDVYRLIRESVPGLQLALLGAMSADDDPESARIAEDVTAHAGDDPDIHIYTDPNQIGQIEVGSVQLLSHVIVQKSLREGFGLTVSEAMWKATPVVAARVGGIPLQVEDGRGGYLVDGIEDAADRCESLLMHPAEARAIGAVGRKVVRSRYLITRLLHDELNAYGELTAGSRPRHSSHQ
jgi:trehalose synthase